MCKQKSNKKPYRGHQPLSRAAVESYRSGDSATDPLGSYTGVPLSEFGEGIPAMSPEWTHPMGVGIPMKTPYSPYDKPVQDVDDL